MLGYASKGFSSTFKSLPTCSPITCSLITQALKAIYFVGESMKSSADSTSLLHSCINSMDSLISSSLSWMVLRLYINGLLIDI